MYNEVLQNELRNSLWTYAHRKCVTPTFVFCLTPHIWVLSHTWISSIWSSKNTLVDTLKIHSTRSDSLLLRKTVIVFLPMCTDILGFFFISILLTRPATVRRLLSSLNCTEMFPQTQIWPGANRALCLIMGMNCSREFCTFIQKVFLFCF